VDDQFLFFVLFSIWNRFFLFWPVQIEFAAFSDGERYCFVSFDKSSLFLFIHNAIWKGQMQGGIIFQRSHFLSCH
jgi:hypothetical protein